MILELPPAYSAIEHENCFAHARDLATRGTEEGTIVYAMRKSSEQKTSASYEANADEACTTDLCNVLEFSLIIQPDFDATQTRQLQIVAASSLGAAIASVITPMVTLRYGWPADIRLNDLTVASCAITLAPLASSEQNTTTPPDWATLEAQVYIDGAANSACTAVNEHCETPVTGQVILETFCRNFLASINRWATDGMQVVSKTWRQRFDFHENENIQLKCAFGDISGVIERVEADATLVLAVDGETRQIQLADAVTGESTRFHEKL